MIFDLNGELAIYEHCYDISETSKAHDYNYSHSEFSKIVDQILIEFPLLKEVFCD